MFFSRPWKTLAVLYFPGTEKPFPEGSYCYAQNQKDKNSQTDCTLDKLRFHLFSPYGYVFYGGAKIRGIATPPLPMFFCSYCIETSYLFPGTVPAGTLLMRFQSSRSAVSKRIFPLGGRKKEIFPV
jgi:hypothetical protein